MNVMVSHEPCQLGKSLAAMPSQQEVVSDGMDPRCSEARCGRLPSPIHRQKSGHFHALHRKCSLWIGEGSSMRVETAMLVLAFLALLQLVENSSSPSPAGMRHRHRPKNATSCRRLVCEDSRQCAQRMDFRQKVVRSKTCSLDISSRSTSPPLLWALGQNPFRAERFQLG